MTDREERRAVIQALRARRRRARLSQRVLGSQIGTPGQLLGEWERGEVTPNLASLIRWARALDCKVVIHSADVRQVA